MPEISSSLLALGAWAEESEWVRGPSAPEVCMAGEETPPFMRQWAQKASRQGQQSPLLTRHQDCQLLPLAGLCSLAVLVTEAQEVRTEHADLE